MTFQVARASRGLAFGAAIGLLPLVVGCAGGAPHASGVAGVTWTAVTSVPAVPGGALTRVIPGGPGFLVIGQAGPSGPGLLWTSADGSAWQPAAQVPALTDKRLLLTVASGSAGTVALGPICNGECGGGYPIVSADLASWTAGSAVEPSDPSAVRDVIWDGTKFLGVGDEITDAAPVGYVAHVWTSGDGLTWKTLPASPALDRATMSSVIKSPAGYVAVGAAQETSGFRAAAWTSADGASWQRSPDSAAFDGAFAYAVVAGGPGFVAVGRGANGAAVWTSVDGSTWARVPDAPALAGAEMHSITAGPGGFVAVGYDHAGAAIFTSPDGLAWARVATLANAAGGQALSVAQVKGVYVAVGGAGPNGSAQPFVWVGR